MTNYDKAYIVSVCTHSRSPFGASKRGNCHTNRETSAYGDEISGCSVDCNPIVLRLPGQAAIVIHVCVGNSAVRSSDFESCASLGVDSHLVPHAYFVLAAEPVASTERGEGGKTTIAIKLCKSSRCAMKHRNYVHVIATHVTLVPAVVSNCTKHASPLLVLTSFANLDNPMWPKAWPGALPNMHAVLLRGNDYKCSILRMGKQVLLRPKMFSNWHDQRQYVHGEYNCRALGFKLHCTVHAVSRADVYTKTTSTDPLHASDCIDRYVLTNCSS